jgi:hypothetical protein
MDLVVMEGYGWFTFCWCVEARETAYELAFTRDNAMAVDDFQSYLLHENQLQRCIHLAHINWLNTHCLFVRLFLLLAMTMI